MTTCRTKSSNLKSTPSCAALRHRLQTTLVVVCVALAAPAAVCPRVSGQTMTVPQMLEQKDKWDGWASDGTRLQLSGRFEGRAGTNFRLQKLSVTLIPPQGNTLPPRMQEGQRIEVSGRLRRDAAGVVFDVNRLAISRTDDEEIRERAAQIDDRNPEALFALIDEYKPIAAYYNDRELTSVLGTLQRRAFHNTRKLLAEDPTALTELAATGETLDIEPSTIIAVRFQAIAVAFRQPDRDLSALVNSIKRILPGWDIETRLPDPEEARYLKNPAAAYDDAATDVRTMLHRRLYRSVRSAQLAATLAADGSNGIAAATRLRTELPEESLLAEEWEKKEIDFRLTNVNRLSRSELQQLADLLRTFHRDAEIRGVVDRWIGGLDKTFRGAGLAAEVRLADEYLFVGEQWSRAQDRDAGIELLKTAWQRASIEAPADATEIADRLKRLGWERFRDAWITSEALAEIPRDDVQMAAREGRVVKGMTMEQVTKTLGEPSRISRLVTSSSIRELWSYDSSGTATLVVHFRRSRLDSASPLVEQVSRTTP